MHKGTFIGLTLGILTVGGVAAAQYPPATYPPAPPPGGGYYPPAGFAPPRPRFGNAGELAFSGDMSFAFRGESDSVPNNTGDNPSSWEFSLRPSADYFVIQGLSVGGFVEYDHTSTSAPPSTGGSNQTITGDTFGFGPRVGYNIPFTDAISWWPLVNVQYSTTSYSGNTGKNAFSLGLFAPFLWHPVSHFFMGIGPTLQTDLSANASANGSSNPTTKVTTYGLQFIIGGWFTPG